MNKEQLKTVATELAEELGSPVAVDGLSNSELESLIDSLQTAVDAKKSSTVADINVSDEPEAEPELMPDFYIAEGKSITTRRGVKVYPNEILKTDFDLSGRPADESKAIFDGWLSKGVIKKG